MVRPGQVMIDDEYEQVGEGRQFQGLSLADQALEPPGSPRPGVSDSRRVPSIPSDHMSMRPAVPRGSDRGPGLTGRSAQQGTHHRGLADRAGAQYDQVKARAVSHGLDGFRRLARRPSRSGFRSLEASSTLTSSVSEPRRDV